MATQNTDLKEAKKDAIMTPDMYRSMFLRQFTSQCSQSYDKMMAMGFMYTIQKPLRKIYPNDDDYYAALDRHTEFFNITPHVLPFVAGLTVSMEEQAAADKNFDTSSINAMKVGLMGPLSGIGDSFYWGTFRVVAAGIGIGIASTGNPLGPIVYALIYSVINFATRIVAAHLGYDLGTKFLQQSEENNLMSRMTHAAGVLGMTVIGAMIAAQVSLSTALTFDVGGSEIVLQDLFDSIFPGLLPLLATFACVALYKKGVKTIWIILGIFAICIIGTLVSELATNRLTPTGGVTNPTARFTITMTPKWIGFIPTCSTIGSKIGLKIRIAGVVSMTIPTIRSTTLMTRSSTISLEKCVMIHALTSCGTCISVSTRENAVDVARINKIGA